MDLAQAMTISLAGTPPPVVHFPTDAPVPAEHGWAVAHGSATSFAFQLLGAGGAALPDDGRAVTLLVSRLYPATVPVEVPAQPLDETTFEATIPPGVLVRDERATGRTFYHVRARREAPSPTDIDEIYPDFERPLVVEVVGPATPRDEDRLIELVGQAATHSVAAEKAAGKAAAAEAQIKRVYRVEEDVLEGEPGYVVEDGRGNRSVVQLPDGGMAFGSHHTGPRRFWDERYFNQLWTPSGTLVLGVTDEGALYGSLVDLIRASAGTGTAPASSTFLHALGVGQSLGSGYLSVPVVSLEAAADVFRFSGGVRPHDTSADLAVSAASLVPLAETVSPDGLGGETPLSGTVAAIRRQTLASGRAAPSLLASSAAEPNKTLAELLAAPYVGRITGQIERGYALATARNETYRLVVTLVQGENDQADTPTSARSGPEYRGRMREVFALATAEARRVAGPEHPVVWTVGVQVANHIAGGVGGFFKGVPVIAMEQLACGLDPADPYVLAAPGYVVEHVHAGDIHLSARGSRHLGEYLGLAARRALDAAAAGEPKWRPLHALSATATSATTLDVTFHVPAPPLVLDYDTFLPANEDGARSGFRIARAGAAAPFLAADGAFVPITAVELTGPSTVRITTSEAIPAGSTLQIGWAGGNGGEAYGSIRPRTNLRDSQALTATLPGDASETPLFNWACVQGLPIQAAS